VSSGNEEGIFVPTRGDADIKHITFLSKPPTEMKECQWLKAVLVGQFEFLEWTPDNHLRHSRLLGLREDKMPRDVGRE
jgi:ATP-dependent DNA ligase